MIAISIDGKRTFTWEGDAVSIRTILDKFPEGAAGVGYSAQNMAELCLRQLMRKGRPITENAVAQEMQMTGVIWLVLTSDTGNNEHPGKIGDYATFTDFDCDFHEEGDQRSRHLRARRQQIPELAGG